MPRAIWTGAISFGLVNVPVRLYSAVSKQSVRFHQLHDADGVRIQQKRVCPKDGEEVAYEHIVKGYEIAPDQYVVIEPEELEALEPQKTRTIDIEDFVDLDEIDPIYYDHPYYLIPGQGAEKPFALLRAAMEKANKVAIAKVVLRTKEYVVAIRPSDSVMTMATMNFHDEIVDPETIDELPDAKAKTGDRELQMAQQLIDSLTAGFKPEKYKDEYRERVLELIERKAAGEEIAVQPAAEEPAKVPDLMAALEASIQAVKKGGGASDGDGDGAKPSRSRKRAATTSKSKRSTSSNGKATKAKPRAKSKR